MRPMSFSLSHGRNLDVTGVGVASEALPPIERGPLDLRQWFAPHADRPLELEIGSGKGTFLVRRAAEATQTNILGIEYARAFWRYAADRCRRRGLVNVRIVNAEAAMFLRQYAPDGCFAVAHIYFPDPWPKKRHHKRRLIQEPFLRLLHRKLQPGGQARIATDHAEYFQWMREHLARVTDLFTCRQWEQAGDELVGSNFERKYRREGRSFHAVILDRLDPRGV